MQEESYILGNDYFTRENLYYGRLGEQVTTQAIKTQFKAKDGFKVKHNSFGTQYEYCCSHGIDITITGDKKPVYIEVKNLKQQPKPYGTDYVKRHIKPRFEGLEGIKILVITYLKLLTLEARQLLLHEGISILATGQRLTSEFFKDLKRLYSLGACIADTVKQLINSSVKKVFNSSLTVSSVLGVYDCLDNYLDTHIPLGDYDNNTNTTTINNKHDTVKQESIENNDSEHQNNIDRIKRLLDHDNLDHG
jgi:hypothetical protein